MYNINLKRTIYIGLNDNFHDPSFCILDENGNILFAEGAERPLQYKRALGCPADLDVYIDDVISKYVPFHIDRVIIASSWTNKSHLKAKVYAVINHFKSLNNHLFPDVEMSIKRHISSLNQAGAGVVRALKLKNPQIIIEKKYFNHHLCHIANALNSSSHKNGMGLVIDGKGDDTSFSYYVIKNGKIIPQKKITTFYSLGYLYGFFTELCGYSQLKGEEWKVMGLSAYGRINDDFLAYLTKNVLNQNLKLESNKLVGIVNQLKDYILLNNISKEEIACVAQLIFEKIFFEVIDKILNENKGISTIFISGGSALNTLALGKFHEKKIFENIIVPNAPADDGNAIGSALLAFEKTNKIFPIIEDESYRSPYCGSEISNATIERYIHTSKLPFKKLNKASEYAAELIHNNNIIGWIQGRAEFGPRALGNRSILAHPGYSENKDRINEVVKFRESYRPFAPSILDEFGSDYFIDYCFTPYMEKTLVYKESIRDKIPAVVHVDGTGRLQSVCKEMNEKYYNLITCFHKLSGLPLVINTSYNVMGKPIAHDINDVMAVFFNSSIDAVFINDYVLERKDLR